MTKKQIYVNRLTKTGKAQITLFIIIAIVVLIILAFGVYVSYSLRKADLKGAETKSYAEVLASTHLRYYISSCLSSSLKEGLLLIGNQGGYIYKGQNGSIIKKDIPSIIYGNLTIPYLIYGIDWNDQEYPNGLRLTALPPYYPCYIDAAADLGFSQYLYSQECYFSYNHSLNLFTNLGNQGEILGIPLLNLCANDIVSMPYICKCTNRAYCNQSIQAQLESYIANRTMQCLNFSSYGNINITLGRLISNITMTSKEVVGFFSFPVTLSMRGKPPVTKQEYFTAKIPVSLFRIYNLAHGQGTDRGIIDYDLVNISFDIVNDGQFIANQIGGLLIKKEAVPGVLNTSIIIIEDISSAYKILGDNYKYFFARQNRRPAIDYFTFNKCLDYDICVNSNDTIIIAPEVYDPDENEIKIEYHGWKSDTPGPSQLYSEITDTNYWESSEMYNDEKLCSINNKNLSHVCANIALNVGDIGEHNVTIEAVELNSEGFNDWQNLKILVTETPNLNFFQCKKTATETIDKTIAYNKTQTGNNKININCNIISDNINFEWTFTDENGQTISGSQTTTICNHNIVLPSVNPPTRLKLKVIITAQNGRKAFENINLYIFPDNDGDQYCGSISEKTLLWKSLERENGYDPREHEDSDDNDPNVN